MRRFVAMRVPVMAAICMMLASGTALAQPGVDANRCSVDPTGIATPLVDPTPFVPPPAHMSRALTPTLLETYTNWDNWNLDTSGVRDATGNLHFAVRLWQYSDRNEHFDRYVFSPDGRLIETWPDWIGPGDQAVVTAAGQHSYLRPSATTQRFGVADSLNNIHVFSTSAETTGWEITYAKLDPDGVTLIDTRVLTTGADAWNFYVQSVVLSDDTVVATWIRDTEDICAICSTDYGETWSDINVLVDHSGAQASCVKTVVGSDDSLHFVWRTLNWTTYVEKLWYAKVRSDWTLAVDETPFFVGSCWYPFASMDTHDNLHITFSTHYDVGTDIYYTRLSGELDLDGAPATDELVTEIPEQVVVSDPDYVHYPLNLVDAFGAVHVVYEEGEYGRFTDKDLYYVRLCSLAGDLDCDEDVDLSDLASLLAIYGVCGGEPGYDGAVDLDGSGCIDLGDLATLLANYGAGG